MKKVETFLLSFAIGFLLFLGINISEKKLENFIIGYIENPRFSSAQISASFYHQERKEKTENLNITARSALVIKIGKNGVKEVLYQKNPEEKLPIASLTKLMTALVVVENYPLDQKIKISRLAVAQDGTAGNLRQGDVFSIEDVLNIMLIESSNDAAFALADIVGESEFVKIMNWYAGYLGLKDTIFANPTGLNDPAAFSTSEDVFKLVERIIREKPLILEISAKKSFEIFSQNNNFHHSARNTNELLDKIPNIAGGKTGFTDEAKGCLVLVLKNDNGDYFVNIILGSDDRFGEMEKLTKLTEE